MEEKVGFWNKLHKSKMRQVIFFTVSIVVLLVIYLPVNIVLGKKALKEKIESLEIGDDNKIISTVESVHEDNGKIIISGWALKEKSINTKIVVSLLDSNGREFVMNTEMNERKDIQNHFDSTWDYGEVGYKAYYDKNELLENECYQVCISLIYELEKMGETELFFSKEQTKIMTNRYVYKDELYRYNPLYFYEPEVDDSEFLNAIKYGDLHVYDLENQVWIYEYNRCLYYIFPLEFINDIERMPELALYAYTTQTEQLPLEMQEYNRDYKFYYITDTDVKKAEEAGMFLYKMSFDVQYPITHIDTGIYFNAEPKEWKWIKTFR